MHMPSSGHSCFAWVAHPPPLWQQLFAKNVAMNPERTDSSFEIISRLLLETIRLADGWAMVANWSAT